MRRYRVPLFFMVLFVLSAAPLVAFGATNTSFFGPLIPAECNCGGQVMSGGATLTGYASWGCVIKVVQNAVSLMVSIGIIIAVLVAAYAGFLWVINPISPENRSTARKALIDAAIGLVITLAAWLIINTILSIIGAGSIADKTSIFGGNYPACETGSDYGNHPEAQQLGNGVGNFAPTSPGENPRGDCSASGLQANGMNANIAPIMSCLTKTEDASCALGAKSGTDLSDNGTGPSVSIGIFQLNISANNLDQYPACKAAVNNASLNCTAAFTGGAYTGSNHSTHLVNQSLYNTCVQAASNPQCNVQAAQDLYLNHGGSRNWGVAAQRGCGG